MVRQEQSFKRPSIYSEYHRTLPNWCYTIDVDWLEWRNNRGIVAFIETAVKLPETNPSSILQTKEFEFKVLSELRRRTKIPTYLTIHTENCENFWVYSINENGNTIFIKSMTKLEYDNFIKTL